MQTILIANPKGGTGKTTLATNVAGWIAGKRQGVAIADLDPQQSASEWLARRPALFPPIGRWNPDTRRAEGIEGTADWLVVDSPAGAKGEALNDAVRRADVILVPIAPSAYDMSASQRFLDQVAEVRAVKRGALPIGLVAMRVDARTHSAAELETFLRGFPFPLVTHLRDTQVYVYCARDGTSVFDLPRSRAEQDWEQWKPLARWIARQLVARKAA